MSTPSKTILWERWIKQTLLQDIQAGETPDPVPLIERTDDELTTHPKLDSYRYGKNDGDYLYLLYFVDGPVDDPRSIVPIYVGESRNISNRLRDHCYRIRDALPVETWSDDGSWGSWGKYDHMAAVFERLDKPLYAWICDVDTIETGPYGHSTYRQELEAKLVGLIRSQPRFDGWVTNREFVPNRTLHEMGKRGPDWVRNPRERTVSSRNDHPGLPSTKADGWDSWVSDYIHADIVDAESLDPIPLFDTTEDLQVRLNDLDRLKRSDEIDARIRREGKKCVHSTGVRDNGNDGLLYVMYQIDTDDEPAVSTDYTASDVIPRYIGKAGAYGKKNELSDNFTEIAKDRDGTRSFARWGDGDYWHTGELSMALFEDDSRKLLWADELFEPGTRTLKEQTYLWVRAWNPSEEVGPYGYHTYLSEVEPLLIGAAYDAYPEQLLNQDGVPDTAPATSREPSFETVPVPSESNRQQHFEDFE